METTNVQHLTYLALYDAAYENAGLTPEQWSHLRECEECTLRFARIVQVRSDLDDLRKKYSA